MRGAKLAIAAALVVAMVAAPAARATVSIGSNLNRIPTASFAGTNTLLNTAMPASLEEPGGLASPVNGTVSFGRILSASTGTAAFQIVHPLGGNLFTGAGTSPTFVVNGNTLNPYPLVLPIKIGEYVAVVADSGLKIDATTASVRSMQFQPALVDGGPGTMPVFEGPNTEITINADITPTNSFTVDAIARDKTKGKATLTLVVSNPGEIAGTGKGAKVSSVARSSKSVTAPGPVPVVIKATGKKGKKLNQTGKVKLSVTLTFTPTGGSPSSQAVKVKLKKNL
jgi:hypothetical protein